MEFDVELVFLCLGAPLKFCECGMLYCQHWQFTEAVAWNVEMG